VFCDFILSFQGNIGQYRQFYRDCFWPQLVLFLIHFLVSFDDIVSLTAVSVNKLQNWFNSSRPYFTKTLHSYHCHIQAAYQQQSVLLHILRRLNVWYCTHKWTIVLHTNGDSGGNVDVYGGDNIGHYEKKKVDMNTRLIVNGYRERIFGYTKTKSL
jgi:hypothetical protein